MKLLRANLFIALLFSITMISNPPARADTAAFMDKLLHQGTLAADLSAHVKILNIRPLKHNGANTLYYLEAKVLRKFLGQMGERLVFHQWAESKLGKADIGKQRIVLLSRNPQDQQYYAAGNGTVLEATPRLLKLATAAVQAKRGRGVTLSANTCLNGSYPQPGGIFAVQIYCDDGLATNIAVQMLKMKAPMIGAYSLTRRSWHGGDWAGDVASYMWGSNKDRLFVTTSPYNGTGNLYQLDLLSQKAQVIWKRGKDDCIALLKREKAGHLLLQVGHCNNNSKREVQVKLN